MLGDNVGAKVVATGQVNEDANKPSKKYYAQIQTQQISLQALQKSWKEEDSLEDIRKVGVNYKAWTQKTGNVRSGSSCL